MPELPEVETVVRGLLPHLLGAHIADVVATTDRLRRPVSLPSLRAACCGRTIMGIRRRAKYILIDLGGGSGLILHLGMTGAFRIVPETEPLATHDRIAWQLADGRSWRFRDVRRFGSVHACRLPVDGADPAMLAELGVEPLGSAFSGQVLHDTSRKRSRSIKDLIMDQSIVAGVGNIYASEALFRAGIRPQRCAGRLGRDACERLAAAIKEVLSEAIEAGGTTIADFHDVDGSEGEFAVHLNAYGRAGRDCPRCGLPAGIRRIVQSGRSSFFCPRCQH
jgi:formamidopyrimidine-DNA glycosylase